MYIIRKNRDRRLYDLNTSSYLTLIEIADLIEEGKLIKIINHEGQDITTIILVDVLAKRFKLRNSFGIDLSNHNKTLINLINNTGSSL